MTTAADLGAFAADVTFEGLPPAVVDATKRRLLDTAGAAFAADDSALLDGVSATTDVAGGDACTRWASDGARAGPASAAADTAATVRASGHADAYLAPGGPSYPSDAIPAVVAAAEHADADGETLLTAVAAAYEVHGELAWHVPVREHGLGPATHSALSAAAGAAVALELDAAEAEHAVALAAADHTSLAVDDGHQPVASANAAAAGVTSALLAANGIEGPTDVFEAHPALHDLTVESDPDPEATAGDAEVDAEEGAACEFDGEAAHDHDDGFALEATCERVHDAVSTRYAGMLAAQPAISAAIDLVQRVDIDPADVTSVSLQTFDPLTLETPRTDLPDASDAAGRSLPYALAVALADQSFGPEHLDGGRLEDPEVRRLAESVTVEEEPSLTAQFDAGLMPAVLAVELVDGDVHHTTVGAYPGHPTQPMDWETLEAKVAALVGEERAATLRAACEDVDDAAVGDFLAALA
ncbi:MmgE/PrpD family protein [Halarchaeum sp. P4]|uniref:MmgE/PrpD family protein n=1 Tax=Halarchaeum sp. P4 TaxID=3421639 RepID=UPI003EBEA344